MCWIGYLRYIYIYTYIYKCGFTVKYFLFCLKKKPKKKTLFCCFSMQCTLGGIPINQGQTYYLLLSTINILHGSKGSIWLCKRQQYQGHDLWADGNNLYMYATTMASRTTPHMEWPRNPGWRSTWWLQMNWHQNRCQAISNHHAECTKTYASWLTICNICILTILF